MQLWMEYKKANELLQITGSIVPAPGHCASSYMVLSRSGKRPHLVIPKKDGGMSCDKDCPQYAFSKHIVAASEFNGTVSDLILSYQKVRGKPPNLTKTKLAVTNMPKGQGWKGGRAPPTRKPTDPVELTCELAPTTSTVACVKQRNDGENVNAPVNISSISIWNTFMIAHTPTGDVNLMIDNIAERIMNINIMIRVTN